MKLNYFLASLLFTVGAYAQSGKIKGTLIDPTTKDPLPFATVSVKGTTNGVNTDMDGVYEIDLKEGDYTLIFQYVGYLPQEKQISITKDKTTILNVPLDSEHVELEGVVVQATRSKARESALLLDQQRSAEIKQHIGSQELSRKGISDVASAVAKTTGVSKQEGSGTIFVRGLGDRYNSTSLNGLPLSSNDPERKNIDLNIFSTDIVEYIAIDKTYNVRAYGDMAGANIDIFSKKQTGKDFIEVGIGSSINSNAIDQSNFNVLSDRNAFGFSSTKLPINPLNSFSFSHSSQNKERTPIGANININAGKTFHFGEESLLDLFATVAFGNKYNYKEGFSGSAQAQNKYTNELAYKSFEYSTNTTAMLNANYKINPDHSIKYNFLFINDSKESNEEYRGYKRDITDRDDAEETLIRRGTYRQDRLFVNQLLGDHKLTDQISINWGGTFNKVTGDTPDRQQYVINKLGADNYKFATNSATDNNRYFENLSEEEFAANISVDYKFNPKEDNLYAGKLTVGYNIRDKKRDFEATQYNFRINSTYNKQIDPYNVDLFFNEENFNQGYFETITFRGGKNNPSALLPQTYNGKLQINAGYANLEYTLSDRLTGVVGVRFESITQDMAWQTQLDLTGSSNKLTKDAFLPSLSLKYALNDLQNLRLAASKTYTLPQFKERALFMYEDVTELKQGNPYLYASDDYNLDIKWEYFPTNDEVYSITAFGKYIKNPINEVVVSSASNDISYLNTGDYGYAAGVEVEIRKNLFHFSQSETNKLTGGLNASWMKTHQKLDNEKVKEENPGISTAFTHKTSSFTGASDLLLNADLSYIKEWKENSLMGTLSYTYFSDKIYSLGTQNIGNNVDKGFGMLDLNVRLKFNQKFGVSFAARNLLDPTIKREQENATADVLTKSYKLGRNFSVGLTYTF